MGSSLSATSRVRATMSIKTVALVSLCVHLTVLTIVLHLSRIRRAPGAPSYKSSSAVILTESGKMLASLLLALRDLRKEEKQDYQLLFESENDGAEEQEELIEKNGAVRAEGNGAGSDGQGSLARTLLRECLGDGYLKLAIPALLFTIQNNLQYVASSNLSVPTFQITYQLKIPFTALCSVLLLGRALSRKQWGSIGLLSIGVAIVQLSVQSATVTHHPDGHTNHPENGVGKSPLAAAAAKLLFKREDPGEANMNQLLGLVAVVISCLCSGFACVYFEKQLKKPAAPAVALIDAEQGQKSLPARPARPTNLWVKNIQLSFFSLIVGTFIYILETVYSSGDSVAFFTGFTGLAWMVVGLQVGGGLLAALVIKHADNIAKVFATSSSIILSFIASIFLFDYHMTMGAVVGGSAVVGSTYMFAMAEQDQPKAAPTNVEQQPVQMSTLSRPESFDEEEDLDKAIDDLEREEPMRS